MMISIIVALDRHGLIGREGTLPWHLPADLKHFKSVTMGKPVIMGRKTYESIGRPLPGRRNIILSRQDGLTIDGCEVYPSVEAVLAALAHGDRDGVADGDRPLTRGGPETFNVQRSTFNLQVNAGGDRPLAEAMVIGGADVYRAFFPQAGRLYVTLVDGEFSGDTWFPGWPPGADWRLVEEAHHSSDERNAQAMAFLRYEKVEKN